MRSRRRPERLLPISHRGFTDRLYFLNLTLSWVFILVCVVVTMLSGVLEISDLSICTYGIPAVFTELSIHTGFIVWKAKAENQRKYGRFKEGDNDYEETDLRNVRY